MRRRPDNLTLDRTSAVPLHLQIERLLRRMLDEAEYRNGKVLPAEPVLADRLGVSRNTLRAAMTRLESEGLLERTPRVGTRVAPRRPHVSLAEWYSFSGEMHRQGIEVQDFELTVPTSRPAPKSPPPWASTRHAALAAPPRARVGRRAGGAVPGPRVVPAGPLVEQPEHGAGDRCPGRRRLQHGRLVRTVNSKSCTSMP